MRNEFCKRNFFDAANSFHNTNFIYDGNCNDYNMKRNYYYKVSLNKHEEDLVNKALAKAKKDKTATFIRDKALKAIRLGID